MKHGKKPTREQKKLMLFFHMDPAMWLVTKNTVDRLELVHRHFDLQKTLPKPMFRG